MNPPPVKASESGGEVVDSGDSQLRPRPRWRRWLVSWVRVSLLIYAGVVVIFTSFQTRLIFPGAATQGSPEAVVQPPPDVELLTLTTARGDRVAALFGKALNADGSPRADSQVRPALLYFYGNAMCLQDVGDELARFRRLGCDVLIPEYVGYGMSGGQAGESGCRETAEAASAYLRSRRDIDPSRIIVAGWSLGGAVAIDLAARHPVAGLATFCTFTGMAEMARQAFPFLPAAPLLQHRFENLAKIARVGCPVLIGHGRADPLIPFAMADRLAAASQTPVTRVTIDEAGHNDFFQTGGSQIEEPLRRFIESLPSRQ